MRILIVEDDPMLGEGLQVGLRQAGFHPEWVKDGEAAWQTLRHDTFSAVVLDLGLPKLDGLEVLKRVRANEQKLPVLVLTARDTAQDVIDGLDSGADDYMVKPFKPSELVARIRTRLRRVGGEISSNLTIGDLAIDIVEHTVTRGGKEIPLTRLEFDLLVALAKEPGRVFTREALLGEVWGYRHSTDTRLVNVHVQRLRAKIEHDPENPTIISTVRGIGYKAGTTGSRG